MIELSNLTYYPIKSCRGFDVAESRVERMGLANDRRMMVVTPKGEYVTQRENARLALITPALKGDSVILSAPKIDSLQFELRKTGSPTPVSIWKTTGVGAIDQGDEPANWLSDWLGIPVRLVHIDPHFKRKLNPDYAVSDEDQTGFADGYPILVISEASLSDLNSRLEFKLPMDRFRPNIVVKGCQPFAEDAWKRIRIGGIEIALVKPCPRCMVTMIDKDTLEKNREPLKTLSKYRMQEGGVMFGMNAIPLGEGIVKIGMNVEVME